MWPTLVCSLWVKIWTNYLIKLNAWWSTASLPQVKYVLRWVLFLRHIELGEDNSTLRQESNKTRAEVDFNWCRTYTMVDRFSSHGFTAKPELVCANGTITHKYCFMGFFYCSSLNQFVWVGQPYAYVVLWFFLLLELDPVCVSGTAIHVHGCWTSSCWSGSGAVCGLWLSIHATFHLLLLTLHLLLLTLHFVHTVIIKGRIILLPFVIPWYVFFVWFFGCALYPWNESDKL